MNRSLLVTSPGHHRRMALPSFAHTSTSARSIAHVGTFPPTQCGLATFGAALINGIRAVSPSLSVGVVDVLPSPRANARQTGAQLLNGRPASIAAAAAFIDRHDAVIVEHEFGIYGGMDGVEVLDLLDRTARPATVVLHTILSDPTVHRRSVIERLAARADAMIVMSKSAYDRLLENYAVDPTRVHIVPHGAHPNPPRPDEHRAGARPLVLSWGLLGPGKGIEAGIDAMRELRDLIPRPRYVVAGETHPKVLEHSGEAYRLDLMRRAEMRGVADMVEFDAAYRSVPELNALIRSADVVLLPYETREQVTSGVLIEAIASQRPVVSTDFPHARELLSEGPGIVVPHGNTSAIASALRRVLCDANLAASMRSAAARVAADAMWPAVARRYLEIVNAGLAAERSRGRSERVS